MRYVASLEMYLLPAIAGSAFHLRETRAPRLIYPMPMGNRWHSGDALGAQLCAI